MAKKLELLSVKDVIDILNTVPQETKIEVIFGGQEIPKPIWFHSIVNHNGIAKIRLVYDEQSNLESIGWAPDEWIDTAIQNGLLPKGFVKPKVIEPNFF